MSGAYLRGISRVLLLFATLTVLVTTRVATAEEENLDSVVITSHRLEETLPEQLAQYGTRVIEIPAEAIRNGGYIDVTQSLQALTPGLFIQAKNGPFDYADISLLGSRTGDVLWLIDGVRVNNRLYATTSPTDTLPAGAVDHIEVLEGGQALFYGTQAVAGAINIVTRPFSDTLKAGVNAGADTHWGRHVDGFVSDGFGPQKFVAYASFDKSDGYRAFRTGDYQPSATDRHRGYDVYTVGAKYSLDVTDSLRLSASYAHTQADLDFALPYRVARDANSRREDLATFKVDYALNDDVGFYVKSYYHRWHTNYDTVYNDLVVPGTLDVLYSQAFWGYNDYGINALSKFSFTKGIDYFLGYDLQVYGGRDEVLFIEPNKEHTHAVFAQIRSTPDLLPNTHFAAGLRFNAPDVGQHATIWNVSGQYDFSDSLFFRTTLGTNFRLPSAEELFANDPQDERGNPNLKPERSESLNASIGGSIVQTNARFTWELVGFARNIKDLIDFGTFDDVSGQDVFDNVAGTVKVRGAQIDLGAYLSDSVSAHASFEANSSKQDGGLQLTRVPARVGKANIDFHPPDRPFGATLAISYTGDVDNSVGGTRIAYGNYAVVDLSGRYFISADRKQRISVSIQNLFDRQYGTPNRGCLDQPTDGPFDCSSPYLFVNRGLPRTAAIRYSYDF
jgi:vitamin B12 transporter